MGFPDGAYCCEGRLVLVNGIAARVADPNYTGKYYRFFDGYESDISWYSFEHEFYKCHETFFSAYKGYLNFSLVIIRQ